MTRILSRSEPRRSRSPFRGHGGRLAQGRGEPVKRDDVLLDIETDKVVIEIFAPTAGVVVEILKAEGDVVESRTFSGAFGRA